MAPLDHPPLWLQAPPAIIRPAPIRPQSALEILRESVKKAPLLASVGGVPAMLGGGTNTISFFNSATSTAATITIPASSPNGSLGVLVDLGRSIGAGGPASVNPNSNWTSIIDEAPAGITQHRISVWYRILDADDEGDVITGMDDTEEDKVLLVFQGTRAIAGVSAQDVTVEGNFANPSAQTCNASGGTPPLIVIGIVYGSGGSSAFSTASPAFDGEVNTSDDDLTVGYKIYNTAPADHSIDMNDLGTNILASFYLEVA